MSNVLTFPRARTEAEWLRDELIEARMLLSQFQGIHEARVACGLDVTKTESRLYSGVCAAMKRPLFPREADLSAQIQDRARATPSKEQAE